MPHDAAIVTAAAAILPVPPQCPCTRALPSAWSSGLPKPPSPTSEPVSTARRQRWTRGHHTTDRYTCAHCTAATNSPLRGGGRCSPERRSSSRAAPCGDTAHTCHTHRARSNRRMLRYHQPRCRHALCWRHLDAVHKTRHLPHSHSGQVRRCGGLVTMRIGPTVPAGAARGGCSTAPQSH